MTRAAFTAIVFVLVSGVSWRMVPQQIGCSGVSAWRRLRDPLVEGIMPVAGKVARPRQRPDRIVADRGYDHDNYRRELWRRSVKPSIARRGTEHGSGLGRWRWVVERTFAWLHNYRRLRIRWEREPVVHMAFLTLACALICRRYLMGF